MRALMLLCPLLLAAPAFAQMSPDDYRAGCSAAGNATHWNDIAPERQAAARACAGTVAVLLHGGEREGICPARPVTEREGASIVADHLEAGTQSGSSDAFRAAAQKALSEAFPCPPGERAEGAQDQR
jgi:hypothetical protein